MSRKRPIKFYDDLKKSVIRECELRAENNCFQIKDLDSIFNAVLLRMLLIMEEGDRDE